MTADHSEVSVRLKALGYLELEDSEGRSVVRVLKRPKQAALLAVLALGTSAIRSRERLMTMFWPESDASRAGHSLSQLLYQLRRDLGDIVESRGDQLVVDPERLWSDVVAFERAVGSEDHALAAQLYRGELLEGLFLSDSPAFEHWVEGRRTALRRIAAQSMWTLAEELAGATQLVEASAMARRAAALSPGEESTVRRLLGFLDGTGDRAGAIAAYDAFARHLATEYELEPSPETRTLAERIRARKEVVAEIPVRHPSVACRDVVRGASEPTGPHSAIPHPADDARPHPAASRVGNRKIALASLGVAAVATLAAVVLVARWTPDSSVRARASVVVVETGQPGENTPAASWQAVDALARALRAELAEAPGISVVQRDQGSANESLASEAGRPDAILSLEPYESGGSPMVEARLVDPETRIIIATQSFFGEEQLTPIVRFLRQRLGDLRRSRAGAPLDVADPGFDQLRVANSLIAGGHRHLDEGRTGIAWSYFMAADSALATAETLDGQWVEPMLSRGWLALERIRVIASHDENTGALSGVQDVAQELESTYRAGESHAASVLERDPASPLGLELRGAVGYSRLQAASFRGTELKQSVNDDLSAAVAADPWLMQSWLRLSRLRLWDGDLGGSLVAIERAVEADPYLRADLATRRYLLRTAGWAGDERVARAACAEGRRDFADDRVFAECRLFLEGWLGEIPDVALARQEFDALEAGGRYPETRGLRMIYLAAVLARGGTADEALALLDEEGRRPRGDDSTAVALGRVRVLSILGEIETGVDSLTAFLARSPGLGSLLPNDPRFLLLRGYPEFEELAQRAARQGVTRP